MPFKEFAKFFESKLREYFSNRTDGKYGTKEDIKAIYELGRNTGADIYIVKLGYNDLGNNIIKIGILGDLCKDEDYSHALFTYDYWINELTSRIF